MKSDLTCPIEVVDVQVNREGQDDGDVVCAIQFLNLIDKPVDSVQMNIVCYDGGDARLGGRLVRASVREDETPGRFSGAFMPEHVENVARVEASVEKVWFKDGAVWRREEKNVREYAPNLLPEGRELDRLRAVAGPDAMGYAREEERLWMCVCGRANAIDDKQCFKCHRERGQVLRDYSYTTIEATIGKRERDLERQTMDTVRRSSEQTVQQMTALQEKKRKRGRRVGIAIAALALVAAGLASWRWGVPYVATQFAQNRLDSGLAADAKEIFEWIDARWPGQFGAGEGALEAETRIIEGLIDTGSTQTLAEAALRAQALGTADALALYERARLAQAALAEGKGDYDGAEAIYRGLSGSETAQERLLALLYRVADEAQERLDYPTAIERFASLGDYEDADARREDCIDLYGRQLLREGHYAEAAEQFLLISGREGAVEMARRSYYALAQEKQAAGENVEAAELFESLGAYERAEELAEQCRYGAGMALLEEDKLEEAAGQLELAGDYEDAAEQFAQAVYALGAQAMEANDPQAAVDWLSKLPRDEESEAALNEATYALAQRQEEDGAREQAAQTYESLGDYEDAAERARTLVYGVAKDEMRASPAMALARFEELGDYADAPELATRCRYLLAEEAYAAGDYESAIDRFDALDDYEDSETRLRRARYALAKQRREEGDFDEAAALYAQCGAYLDAEEMALRSRYDAANALQEQGKLSEAARAFHALGSYEDAPARARAAEDAWLRAPYADALIDMELGDYDSVIASLSGIWQEELPARYADIPALYVQACIARADELIAQNRPLDALPLLEGISQEDEAQERLQARVYQVIGAWETADGARYVFRPDGTCSLNGREAYFGGKNYDIAVGDAPYPTRGTYEFVRLSKGTLTLRSREDGSLLRLKYIGEPLDLVDAQDGDGQ